MPRWSLIPGRAFQPAEPTVYARPDVFIVELEGELRVMLNEYYLPRISINGYYSDLARESDDPEARTYLKEKLRQTKWLLESLERRAVPCGAARRPFWIPSGHFLRAAPPSWRP